MPLLTFNCDCGWQTDLLRARDCSGVPCPACGEDARRQSVYLFGVTGFTPTPTDQRVVRIGKFQEATAELEYQHSRQTAVDGSLLPTPSLWNEAKREVKRLTNLGVQDSSQVRSTA